MKVTVEVECTPAEARSFLGLPNVERMQDAIMADLERTILREMDRFSPDALINTQG